MRTQFRIAAFLLVALGLLISGPLSVRAVAGPVIYVHDYVTPNDQVDDYTGIQNAINAWIASQRAGGPATLDFGAGNYLVCSGTLKFERTDGGPIFGTVRGDGPEATIIRSCPGQRAAQVRGFKYGQFGGIKFSGGPAKDNDLNHAGLVIGDPGLVNGARFHNLTFEHYGVGLGVGDWVTAGAAAELKFDNIGASQNDIGVMAASFNTLDNVFSQLNLSENDIGFYSDTAYGFQFLGGAGTNNGTTFVIKTCCEWLIDGWREEYGAKTSTWIQYGSPAADTHLIVRGSNTVDTLNPHRRFTDAIQAITPGSSVIVEGSLLNGAVSGKKITILNSAFTAGPAVSQRIANPIQAVLQSCWADLNSGQCTGDIPNRITGMT
jgi:hypothetical protein